MTIYISHISALEYLARAQPDEPRQRLGAATCTPQGKPGAHDIMLIASEHAAWLSSPVHAIVACASDRSRSKRLACHVCHAPFPAGSFAYAGKGVFAASPELSFVLMAHELSQTRLIRLGMELCGTYGIPTAGHLDFTRDHPYTSTRLIERFAKRAQSLPGASKALRAIAFVVDGSASPLETAMYLLLCLPPRMGGYGLPAPVMNRYGKLRKKAGRDLAERRFACDLLWKDAGIALEYDSAQFHASRSQLQQDARRRTRIMDKGFNVISATTCTARNLIELDQVARLIAKRLGKRLHVDTPNWSNEQHKLHGMLMDFDSRLEQMASGYVK